MKLATKLKKKMGKNHQFCVCCNYRTTESFLVSCKSVKEIAPSSKELPNQQHNSGKSRHAVCSNDGFIKLFQTYGSV